MVIVETVRLFIRPLTLSIRLAANIVAGHLLICLAGDRLINCTVIDLVGVGVVEVVLTVLETRIAVIQAYVFAVLITLYISEVDSRVKVTFNLTN